MSRIRTNLITNRMANGAPTVSNGLVISGVTTSTTFSGSGASLTNLPAAQLSGTAAAINGSNITNLNASNISSGTVPTARLGSGTANSSTFLAGDSTYKTVTGTTINNNANNRLITGSGTANTLEGESTLTYDGNKLKFGAGTRALDNGYYDDIVIDNSDTASGETGGVGISLISGNQSWCGLIFGDVDEHQKAYVKYSNQSDFMQIVSGDHIRLETNGSERVRIDSNGDLGLGIAAVPQDSGARTLHIHDTDTGSGARAAIRLTHGSSGSSASNGAFIGFDNNPDFYIYNQEAGNLRFGTNGNERMRVDSNGYVTKPTNPSFAAMRNYNGAYSLNNQVFPFDATTHNNGSHYNTSNYRFTAPVAGRYLFTFYSILNSSGQGRYEILINGAANQYGTRVHMTPTTTDWDHVSTSWILELSANDYIQMTSVTNTGWHGGHWQRFCGELLS